MAKLRPMRINDLFRLKVVGAVALAPDGGHVVFELKRADVAENKNFTNLMLADVETGELRPLTSGNHNDTCPKWSPDGRSIAFISNRDKVAGLWVLPMTGGEPQRVTDREGSVSDFDWSPDGKKLAYTYQPLSDREKLSRDGKQDEAAKRPQFMHITRIHHKLDGAGWKSGEFTHIHVISVKGGKAKQLSRGDYDDSEPRFSPDGTLVTFVSNRADNPDLETANSDIFAVRATGGQLRQLTKFVGGVGEHSWSPDGKTIAFLAQPGKTGESWKYRHHVWTIPAGGGKPRNLAPEIDDDCMNAVLGDVAGAFFNGVPPIWSADSSRVWFIVAERGCGHLYTRSLKKGKARRVLAGQQNIITAHRAVPSGPLAVVAGTATNPADVFIADLEAETLRPLTEVNSDALRRVHVSAPEPFEVRSDNVSVQGWVLKPPGFNPRRKYPAILEVHGGPHAAYGECFMHEFQYLAANGYVVFYSNPRGSDTYGLNFRKAIRGDWGNLDWKDIQKVTDYIARQSYIDSKRIGITGGSYGGYMTNWAVGHSQRYRAAVTQRSVVNFESMFGTSDFGRELGLSFGGVPWEKQAQFRKQSPLTFVDKIRTPLLIIHSEQDLRCPIEQAEQLFISLKVLGRETEFIRFEGESHGLSRGGRPQNRAERLQRILAWFDKYMK